MNEEWKIIRTTKTRIIKVSNLGNLQDIYTRDWHNCKKGQIIFNNVLINKENGYIRSKACNEYVHKEAERELGIASTNIGKCCLGKRPYAGGYIWKYANI